MVMTRSSRVSTKKVRKKSSNIEGKNFYQDGSAMEPLHYAPPPALMPYETSEDEAPITNAPGLKQNSSIESHNA